MKQHWLALLVGGQVMMTMTALGASNLLTNPSFEIDVDADNLPDGWQRYNEPSASGGGWTRYDEDQSAEAQAAGASDGAEMMEIGVWYAGFAVVYQDVSATPATNYTFSADIAYPWGVSLPPSVANSEIKLKLEFFDVGDSKIGEQIEDLAVIKDNTYQNFSVSAISPAGTVRVRPVIVSEYWNYDNGGTNWLADNTLLTPEPTSLGMLVLLGVLGLRRR